MSFPVGTARNQANVGVTVRPSSTALLTIDSEDRYNNYSEKRSSTEGKYNYNPYNFTISKNQSLMNGYFTRLAVTEVVFPWGIPNINKKTCSINFLYKVGAVQTAYTIDLTKTYSSGQPLLSVGFYNPAALAATITGAVKNLTGSTTFLMTYGYAWRDTGSQNRYIENIPAFEYTTGNTDQIAWLPMIYNTPAYPFPNTTRQLFDLLGFDDVNGALNLVGYGNPTLAQAVKYVDICCPTLTYNQDLKDTSSAPISQDSLCRIYLGNADNGANQLRTATDISGSGYLFCPPGCAPTTIYRQFNVPKFIQWVPNQPVPGSLVFQVLDDQGAILDPAIYNPLTNSQPLDWQMTLLVSEN